MLSRSAELFEFLIKDSGSNGNRRFQAVETSGGDVRRSPSITITIVITHDNVDRFLC